MGVFWHEGVLGERNDTQLYDLDDFNGDLSRLRSAAVSVYTSISFLFSLWFVILLSSCLPGLFFIFTQLYYHLSSITLLCTSTYHTRGLPGQSFTYSVMLCSAYVRHDL